MNIKQAKALQLVDRFNPNCIGEYGAFNRINKYEFLDALKESIQKPITINQGEHPLCGIACLVKIAAELDPINLVKMGAHFYANGRFNSPSFLKKSIKTPRHLQGDKPQNGLSASNHVIQTSIKSFLNPITGYNNRPGSKFNEWQGITLPFQIKRFLTTYFKIQSVPARTYFHTIQEIQKLLKDDAVVLAWTSWNQMIHPGGKFKMLKQHYVLIKSIKTEGKKVWLTIDNPRKRTGQLQEFKFNSPKEFYRAIVGIYPFKSTE